MGVESITFLGVGWGRDCYISGASRCLLWGGRASLFLVVTFFLWGGGSLLFSILFSGVRCGGESLLSGLYFIVCKVRRILVCK